MAEIMNLGLSDNANMLIAGLLFTLSAILI